MIDIHQKNEVSCPRWFFVPDGVWGGEGFDKSFAMRKGIAIPKEQEKKVIKHSL